MGNHLCMWVTHNWMSKNIDASVSTLSKCPVECFTVTVLNTCVIYRRNFNSSSSSLSTKLLYNSFSYYDVKE